MFKKSLSILLAVVMLMSLAVVAVSAAEPSDKLYIRVDGDVYYEVQQGETYTYVYSLACDKKVCSLDCTTFFDAEGLKFLPDVDGYGDFTGTEFPNITAVYNFNKADSILFNYSSPSGVRFPVADTMAAKNVVFQGKFEVTAESGIFDIYTDLKVLGDSDNNKIIFDSVKVDEAAVVSEVAAIAELQPVDAPVVPTEPQPTEPQPTEPTPTEPQPTEPSEAPTEAPTQAPTEAPTVEPTEENTDAPAPATKDQSSTDDTKKPTNSNAVKTGSTAAAIVFITVLVMAAGVVMFTSKKKFN